MSLAAVFELICSLQCDLQQLGTALATLAEFGLADHADQIVLVTTWGKTPRQLLRRAIHLLGANEAKIAGAIVNQMDAIEHAKMFGYGHKMGSRTPSAPRRAA